MKRLKAFLEPLRVCMEMVPRALHMRLALTMPLNIVVAALESASAGAIYFLIKIVGDERALHTMRVGEWLRRVVPDATHKTLILAFTAMLAVFYAFKVVFTVWATLSSRRALKHANIRVASLFFRAYVVAPYSVHFRRNSAELTAQINREIPETLNGVIQSYMQLFLELVVCLGLLGTMFVAAPQVTLILGGIAGITMYVLLRWTKVQLETFGLEANRLVRKQARRITEGLGAIKEIKVLGREPYFLDQHAALVAKAQENQLRKTMLDALPRVVIESVFAAAGLGAIALHTVNEPTGGDVVPLLGMYAYGAFRLIPTANRITQAIGALRWRRQTLNRIYGEYEELKVAVAVETHAVDRGVDRVTLRERLVFEEVGFKYAEDAAFALKGLSFEVERGKSYGIVGPTGAGKSTVIDLLLGLLEPSVGRITVDGTDITELGVRWRRSIGYVPQQIFVSDDSVRRNVALGIDDADIDDERVWAALSMAQLADFVRTLSGELDASVGERGTMLSGGQRQRIGIARALYHDPSVLVFDEATSALDVTTEAEVTRAIEALLGVKTVIVVAHRLSTVRHCERLFLLSGGQLAASGHYDDLARDNPMFRTMAQAAG